MQIYGQAIPFNWQNNTDAWQTGSKNTIPFLAHRDQLVERCLTHPSKRAFFAFWWPAHPTKSWCAGHHTPSIEASSSPALSPTTTPINLYNFQHKRRAHEHLQSLHIDQDRSDATHTRAWLSNSPSSLSLPYRQPDLSSILDCVGNHHGVHGSKSAHSNSHHRAFNEWINS